MIFQFLPPHNLILFVKILVCINAILAVLAKFAEIIGHAICPKDTHNLTSMLVTTSEVIAQGSTKGIQ